jgi:hypothetical protein
MVMTCSGNPKADPLLCQQGDDDAALGDRSLGGALQDKCSHNADFAGAFENKSDGALRNKWCTSKQKTVHLKARNGALRNKK